MSKARTIAISNQKGGVAKTTTAVNLAGILAEKGKRVLIVDADAQANATNALGINDNELEETLIDLLCLYEDPKHYKNFNRDTVHRFIVKTEWNIDVLPSSITLSDVDRKIGNALGREDILYEILSEVKDDYDYIIIDCPPSLGLMCLSALVASDYIVIPIYPSFFSVKGLQQLMALVETVQRKVNQNLKVMGFCITKYDKRVKQHSMIAEEFENVDKFGYKTFSCIIRTNAEIEKAQSNQKPINIYNKDCNGYIDYENLTMEVLNYE